MFENIPNLWLTVALALVLVGFVAVLMCVNRYLENEKDNANKRKLAKMDGTDYDTVNEALGKKFWYGYLVVAVVGAFVSVALGLILTDLVDAYYHIEDDARLMCVCLALCVGVWLVGDYALFTRLGDSAYFARVERSAISVFLGDTEVATEEPVELTEDEKRALIEKLFSKK